MTNKTVHEPLFQISKRGDISLKKAILIRTIAIAGGLIFVCCLCGLLFSGNPLEVLGTLFEGSFGTERRIWTLLRDLCLLLGVGIALVPAFKMKFWNLGGNGQILMGALVAIAIMRSPLGAKSEGLANILMVVGAILAGAIWAVIPAIFKAFFKTNESLFTLMMNYIAVGLVSYFVNEWSTNGSGVLGIIHTGHLPELGNDYILTILIVVILTVAMFFYMRNFKQGYEVAVVGESEKTAKYAGMNVKKVMIRTLAISGAICGVIGLLLAGSINHSINEQTANNMGFTAIMVAWLGKFNPFMMIATSFLIVFMTQGMGHVQSAFNVTNNSVSNMLTAIIYFIIIACEFFISYKIKINKRSAKPQDGFIAGDGEKTSQQADLKEGK